jgi:hypothetical protein
MSLYALLNLGMGNGKHAVYETREGIVFGCRIPCHAHMVAHRKGIAFVGTLCLSHPMTTKDQEIIVGHLVLEDTTNSLRLNVLRSGFRQMADELENLTHKLNNSPGTIDCNNISFDKSRLPTLIEEYRQCKKKQDTLDRELKALGIRPEPIVIPES